MRTAQSLHSEDDDYGQAGSLYREVLSETDREHFVNNIIGHLGADVEKAVQERAVGHWRQVDSELGAKIAAGIGLDGSGNGAVPEIPASRSSREPGWPVGQARWWSPRRVRSPVIEMGCPRHMWRGRPKPHVALAGAAHVPP